MLEKQTTRREVIKKAAYIAPAILTLTTVPSFAGKGSGGVKSRSDGWKSKSNGGKGKSDEWKSKSNGGKKSK